MSWTERQRAMLRELGVQTGFRQPAASADLVPEPALLVVPGLMRADVLIVGEPEEGDDGGAAGEQERLLGNMLHAIGFALSTPGPSGRACLLTLRSGERVDLRDAIERVRPRCVLALGRGAAQLLLGSEAPLGRLRGKLHEHRGIAVVVSFSLAYLLRHPDEKGKAWADLCLAVATLEKAPG